jgi:predicted ribosomally synthesized peptide with nif11-like leader
MTQEQLKAFLAKVKDETSLQGKLKDAKSSEEVVAIAKEHGHDFTADKLNQLSADELEQLSGGKFNWCVITEDRNSGICVE